MGMNGCRLLLKHDERDGGGLKHGEEAGVGYCRGYHVALRYTLALLSLLPLAL